MMLSKKCKQRTRRARKQNCSTCQTVKKSPGDKREDHQREEIGSGGARRVQVRSKLVKSTRRTRDAAHTKRPTIYSNSEYFNINSSMSWRHILFQPHLSSRVILLILVLVTLCWCCCIQVGAQVATRAPNELTQRMARARRPFVTATIRKHGGVSGGPRTAANLQLDFHSALNHQPYSPAAAVSELPPSSQAASATRSRQKNVSNQQPQQQHRSQQTQARTTHNDGAGGNGAIGELLQLAASTLNAAVSEAQKRTLAGGSGGAVYANGTSAWIPIVSSSSTNQKPTSNNNNNISSSNKYQQRLTQASGALPAGDSSRQQARVSLSLAASSPPSHAHNASTRLLQQQQQQQAHQRQQQQQPRPTSRHKLQVQVAIGNRNQNQSSAILSSGRARETQLAQSSHPPLEYRHFHANAANNNNHYQSRAPSQQQHHHYHHYHHHHWAPLPPPPPFRARRPRFQQAQANIGIGEHPHLDNDFDAPPPPPPSKMYKRVLLCDKTLVSLDYIRNLEQEPRPLEPHKLLNDHEINEINDNFLNFDLEGNFDSSSSLARSSNLSSGAAAAATPARPRRQRLEAQAQLLNGTTLANATSATATAADKLASNESATTIEIELPTGDYQVSPERRIYPRDYASASLLLNDQDPLVRCDMWDLEKGLKSRKPPQHILRMAVKADFDTVRDAINRCRQLSEKTLPPDDDGSRDGALLEPLMSTEDLVSLFSMKRGLMPGTKWCGLGDQAETYNDLGSKHRIDICCRAHDHCPIRSKPFRNDYGVLNIGLYTKSHCDCDADFYRCLREVRSRTADMLGNLYFNVMKLQCMREERLKVCREMKPIALGFERCIRYEDSPARKTVFKFTTPPVAY